jgi:galactitol-specific phosphotransferase system IIC component
MSEIEKENLVNISDLIEVVLFSFYKKEVVHLKMATKKESSVDIEYNFEFIFKEYTRTLENLGHVSMAQIHEAIMEAMYIIAADFIKNSTEKIFTIDDFKIKMKNAIYYKEEITFKKMLDQDTPVQLGASIIKFGEKKSKNNFYIMKVSFSGFIKGEVTCLLPK